MDKKADINSLEALENAKKQNNNNFKKIIIKKIVK
jgi:hypothetical protein